MRRGTTARASEVFVFVVAVRAVVVGQRLDRVVVAGDRLGRVERILGPGDTVRGDVGAVARAFGHGLGAFARPHGIAVALQVGRRGAAQLTFFGVGLQTRRALAVAAAVGEVARAERVGVAATRLLGCAIAAEDAALGHDVAPEGWN